MINKYAVASATSKNEHLIMPPLYLQKLDLKEPGLFVTKINCTVPSKALMEMSKIFNRTINEFSPDSKVIILGPEFETATLPDEDTMKKLGWMKIPATTTGAN